jgi:FMN phosphatase YigB (HAD superfamily)
MGHPGDDVRLRERLQQVDTLLFDLDGTLLENDMDVFLPHYLRAVATWASHLAEPARFSRQLMASTQEMVINLDPAVTNADAFAATFYPALGLCRARCEPIFADFYERDFPKLQSLTRSKPASRRLLEVAVGRGLGLVLATNPVFPRAAIEERMRWAQVSDFPWRLVTTYETMHFCKPQLGYYREILDLVGRSAEQCMMVGNDVEEDAVAGRLGMLTFLDPAQLIQRAAGPIPADFVGSLDELCEIISAGS